MGQVSMSRMFFGDFQRLPKAVGSKVEGWLGSFLAKPDDPRFEAHRLKRTLMPNLWTAKLTDSYRVVYRQDRDGTINLLCCGAHDEVYGRVERMRLVREQDQIQLVDDELPASDGDRRPLRPSVGGGQPTLPGRMFMAWTDAELLGANLPEHLLPAVRACDTEDDLLELAVNVGERWSDFLLGLRELLMLRETEASAGSQPSPVTVDDVADATEAALRSPAAAGTLAFFEPDELTSILGRPIEDWMIFLHRAQESIARRRSVGGPARVRGAAGTGKTVVALHRTAYLAERDSRVGGRGKILFTTFISSLPPVMESLFQRLAPEVGERVEFVHPHRWASQLLRSRGQKPVIDPEASKAAFTAALETPAGQRLLQTGLARDYLSEEIEYLIKGRVLGSVEAYLELPRTARGTPLRAEQRRDVWEVAQEYARRCAEMGVRDFADLITDALHELRQRPLDPPYSAIVVDEAQDLTEAALRMLMAALRPGGELLIVGDGQQSIYPGGFSLRSLGLDVRGRSAVLTTAYRSTAEIMRAAMAVMAGHDFDDLEEQPSPGRREVIPVRHGPDPVIRGFSSRDEELRWIVGDIRRRQQDGEADFGDIAVLCATKRGAGEVRQVCAELRLPNRSLESYKGRSTDEVKVGTLNRGKGLEFKLVYLPGISAGVFPREAGDSSDAAGDLDRRRFFVGTTRARDGLVITHTGAPSELLEPLLSRD